MSVSGRTWRRILPDLTARGRERCQGVAGWSDLAIQDRRGGLAEADAHRREAVAEVALLHLVEQRGEQARARASERVAERDGAAVDVHAGEVPAQLLRPGERDGGERLVDLDQADV